MSLDLLPRDNYGRLMVLQAVAGICDRFGLDVAGMHCHRAHEALRLRTDLETFEREYAAMADALEAEGCRWQAGRWLDPRMAGERGARPRTRHAERMD